MLFPQRVVSADGVLDRAIGGYLVPVGQDMGGDEVDRRGELGGVFRLLGRLLRLVGEAEPDVEGFAGCDRHRALALDPLDDRDELVDCLFPPQYRLVADHDRVDVAVAACQRDRGLDFLLVTGIRYDLPIGIDNVLVDPDAERDLEPELRGNRGHELDAAGRAVGADRLRVRAEDFQVGANLLRCRAVAVIGMLRSCVRRIGDAGERSVDIGDRLLPLEQSP